MGVYIKGMEMPRTCFKCKLSRITPSMYAFCSLNEKCYPADETPPSDCPLVPVPTHGRLIDADALTDAMESTDWYHQAENKDMVHGANSAEHQAWYKEQDVYSAITKAPTIIPAEDGEMFTDEARREFIKRFEDFPDQVIATAWAYAVGLTKFGVGLSKEGQTVTQKRAELDLAYRKGRQDERERIYAKRKALAEEDE